MSIPKEKGIKSVGSLFDKYKHILKAPQGVVVDSFIEVVSDLIGVQIPKEKVSYTTYNKTLTVRISGPLRTEIKLKQEEILSHMKGRLGTQSAPKIIL